MGFWKEILENWTSTLPHRNHHRKNQAGDHVKESAPAVDLRSLEQSFSSTPSNSLESGGLYLAQKWELDNI